MATITRETILQGGFFTLTTPDNTSYCYEVNFLVSQGKRPVKWFVRLATETESFYIGELKTGGEIVRTKASCQDENSFVFRLANRVFQAVMGNRIAVMEQHGYTLRIGTPNDQHEETAYTAPVAAPAVKADVAPRTAKVGSLYHFDYDIHGERFTMDYSLLYSRAIMTSESCYYFEGSQIPYPMLDEMWAAGCTANLVRTHDDEIEALLVRAEQQITKKLAEKEASLAASLDNAYADYAADIADETISTEKARKRYDARIKAATRSADKLVQCFAESAKRYGLRIDLTGVQAASSAMADRAKARAAAYSKAAEQVQGTLFGKAASDGDIPHQVLADVLTDAGNDDDASELMAAFSGEYDLETNQPV